MVEDQKNNLWKNEMIRWSLLIRADEKLINVLRQLELAETTIDTRGGVGC